MGGSKMKKGYTAIFCLGFFAGFSADAGKTVGLAALVGEQSFSRTAHRSFSTVAPSKPAYTPQVYGIGTYDALFKRILGDNNIRPSFLRAFIPNLAITASKRVDEILNPRQELERLRKSVCQSKSSNVVKSLSKGGCFYVGSVERGHKTKINQATANFLEAFVGRFGENPFSSAVPKPRHEGLMDFVCILDTGDYALVELQVISQEVLALRPLAYVAAFYGHQLRHGIVRKNIRKVIGVNILGAEPDRREPKASFFMEDMEILQYSINQGSSTVRDQEQRDWIAYFKEGPFMNEGQVKKKIKTPAVLDAFEKSKLLKLPRVVKDAYEEEEKEYAHYFRSYSMVD